MIYRDAIIHCMDDLARDSKVIFIGYNLNFGSRGYKTLINIPKSRVLETPVAENLMVGLAIGLSLEGFKPVLIFERQDFMLNALDALVNHLDKIKELSFGEYAPCILIRAIVGSTTPIDPGPQHKQDFSDAFNKMFKNISVYEPKTSKEVLELYERLKTFEEPAIIIERRDLHKKET